MRKAHKSLSARLNKADKADAEGLAQLARKRPDLSRDKTSVTCHTSNVSKNCGGSAHNWDYSDVRHECHKYLAGFEGCHVLEC
jgi:hypothetical protein